MMSLISKVPVLYYPATGEVHQHNPVPERANKEHSGGSSKGAARQAGVGRIDWDAVESYSKKDVADFKREFQISDYLASNAKTDKPRPGTGRRGQIMGLSLAPHFYPNMLAHATTETGRMPAFMERI